MVASVSELLAPQVVLDVISRIKEGRGPLGSWLGFQANTFDPETLNVSGPNTMQGEGSLRNYTYRIFDHTRVPLSARAPGTGPGTVAQNPMGVNTVSIARFHEKMPLNYEFLGNLSPMIGPNSVVDQAGRDYIGRQTAFLAEKGNNMIEMLAAGMMRDSLYFYMSGDNWRPSFTAPVAPVAGFQVSFQIPAGNKNQLNMLGAGNLIGTPWDNNAAPIFGDIRSIIAAYRQLSRYPMTDIWINSLMWINIITNTQVRNVAGSSTQPFATFDKTQERGMDGTDMEGQYYAVLHGEPSIRWHFCDDVVALNTDIDPSYATAPSTATLAKLIPDNMVLFTTKPSKNWCRLVLGGEYVIENPGMPARLRQGWHFWHEYSTQPAVIELIALLNAVPALFIPTVIAPAIVTGF